MILQKAAIQNFSHVFMYCSPELKDNDEIVMTAITQNGLLLQYASDRLKHNRTFVQKAVFNNHHVLPYLPREFQTDLLILNENYSL